MRTTVKLALTALTAAVALASAVSSSSASHLSVSNQRFRAVWTPLTFSEPFGFFTVRCNITMEGSFHSATIAKTIGSLIGYVTAANVAHPCTGGEAWAWNGTERFLRTGTSLPWHMRYNGFTGTLPNIATIRLILERPKFTIEIRGICLGTYQPTSQAGTAIFTSGTTRIEAGRESTRPIEGNCPAGSFNGTSNTVTLQGTTTAITIRLI